MQEQWIQKNVFIQYRLSQFSPAQSNLSPSVYFSPKIKKCIGYLTLTVFLFFSFLNRAIISCESRCVCCLSHWPWFFFLFCPQKTKPKTCRKASRKCSRSGVHAHARVSLFLFFSIGHAILMGWKKIDGKGLDIEGWPNVFIGWNPETKRVV